MSTLRVNNITDASGSSSSLSVPGAAKAWVNFNGTGTVAIRAALNVTSITDNGVGDCTVNFTTALADANYSVTGQCNGQTETIATHVRNAAQLTTSSRVGIVRFTSGANQATDCEIVCFAFFR